MLSKERFKMTLFKFQIDTLLAKLISAPFSIKSFIISKSHFRAATVSKVCPDFGFYSLIS